jgi:hypothetical protein
LSPIFSCWSWFVGRVHKAMPRRGMLIHRGLGPGHSAPPRLISEY